jgi:hypothetical protein
MWTINRETATGEVQTVITLTKLITKIDSKKDSIIGM